MDSAKPLRIAAIGECMIELSHLSDTRLQLAYGGDTLNTSVYLARLLAQQEPQRAQVDYITALGHDPYSAAMLDFWQREGIGTSHVILHPSRRPGLYTIHNDADGERHFYYWRGEAAVRTLFDDAQAETVEQTLLTFDWLYLTGVTLSLFTGQARTCLLAILSKAHAQGTRIAFDLNFRPAGWPDRSAACQVFDTIWPLADVALPSFDDMRAVYDTPTPKAAMQQLSDAGAKEVVIKNGAGDTYICNADGVQTCAAESVSSVRDTTAAGDSFNAAYLAARLAGADPNSAAEAGHRLAAAVIGWRGAVLPASEMPS